MNCIPNETVSNSTEYRGFDDTLLVFLIFISAEMVLCLLLIFVLVIDETLLTKQFNWFIFFENVFYCLSILTQIWRNCLQAATPTSLYLYNYFYKVFLSISIWLLTYRSFVQQRIVKKKPVQKTSKMKNKYVAFITFCTESCNTNVDYLLSFKFFASNRALRNCIRNVLD